MDWFFDWLINIPNYLADMYEWLNTPINIGTFSGTPLTMLGASAGVFLVVIIALKIKSLVLL